MIVKNEENTLGNCLESVKDIVDEIVIVDTGSTDKTKEVASKFTDKIFDFEWIDDFPPRGILPAPRPQRNMLCGLTPMM